MELVSESNNFESTVLGPTKTDFAAALFSIGDLLLEVDEGEKAISAYNLAIDNLGTVIAERRLAEGNKRHGFGSE